MSVFRDEMPDRPTVQLCADHEGVEMVPGPFCPVCTQAQVFQDGREAGKRALDALTAERDALAALLKEARFFVPSHDDVAIRIDAALARLDAASGRRG